MKVKDLVDYINTNIGLNSQEKWDNSGLQIGCDTSDITGVLLTMDITNNSVDEAIKNNTNVIISHHPFFFSSIKSIDTNSIRGKIIEKIIKNNINIYSFHTSLDLALNGVTQSIAKKLEINNVVNLVNNNIVDGRQVGYGGIGSIKETPIIEFSQLVKEELNCEYVKLYTTNCDKRVKKVAFCGGSGADFIENAIINDVDVYITGDIKYHDVQYAFENKLSIIDAGHYYTEHVVLYELKEVLSTLDINVQLYDVNYYKEKYI